VRRVADGAVVQSGGLGASVNNALHIGSPAPSANPARTFMPRSHRCPTPPTGPVCFWFVFYKICLSV